MSLVEVYSSKGLSYLTRNTMSSYSMATLSPSMSKSDLHFMKIRLDAQWRMNRLRAVRPATSHTLPQA